MGLFGPSKKEVWEQLSRDIQADYIDGGFWTGDKVQAQVGNWIVVLDTYIVSTGKSAVPYTRIRAPFINLDNFYFKIYRKGVFSDLGKLLGMQDINTGYDDFDEDFIIKCNNEEKGQQLFSNERIRALIQARDQMNMEVKDDEGFFAAHFPQGVDELYFMVPGVIKDVEALKELFELFSEVLQELCRIGSASSSEPGVSL